MRAQPTAGEVLLWEALRGSELVVKFRRQVPTLRAAVEQLAAAAEIDVKIADGDGARRLDR